MSRPSSSSGVYGWTLAIVFTLLGSRNIGTDRTSEPTDSASAVSTVITTTFPSIQRWKPWLSVCCTR